MKREENHSDRDAGEQKAQKVNYILYFLSRARADT